MMIRALEALTVHHGLSSGGATLLCVGRKQSIIGRKHLFALVGAVI